MISISSEEIGRFITSEVTIITDFGASYMTENRMKSLGRRCETEAYVQRKCFIHATRGRATAATGMEHRALEKDKIP